ncbi:hypothetical protein EON73_00850 [bacterium]|nr:MAG: hypothetical protein EON73_00850 [bacterium]
MKYLLTSFMLFLLSFAAKSQTDKFNYHGYKPLPSRFIQRDSLIRFINPVHKYIYWEYVQIPADPGKAVVFSQGVKPEGLKIKILNQRGFFSGCLPSACTRYIAYVDEKGEVGYITTAQQAAAFVGTIDNLEEAVLVAQLGNDDFYVDKNAKGGSYKIKGNTYEVILTHYDLCPETSRAIQLRIDHKQILEKKELGIYFQTKDCITI